MGALLSSVLIVTDKPDKGWSFVLLENGERAHVAGFQSVRSFFGVAQGKVIFAARESLEEKLKSKRWKDGKFEKSVDRSVKIGKIEWLGK